MTEPGIGKCTLTVEAEGDPPVGDILRVLADPRRLPEWAPAFADRVERTVDGDWRAVKAGRSFHLRVAVDLTAGTVDYLRQQGSGDTGGAHISAVPRAGGGTHIAMTVPLPPGQDRGASAEVLARELRALLALGTTAG